MLNKTEELNSDRLRYSLLSQGSAQIFKLVILTAIGGWTARYLGPYQLGTLSYVTALVGLFSPLGNFSVRGSLGSLLCREYPPPGLIGSALLLELIGTVVLAIVMVPFAFSADDPVVAKLIVIAVLGNLVASAEVFEVELLNLQLGTKIANIEWKQTVFGALASVSALLLESPLILFGSINTFQFAIRSWLLAKAVNAKNIVLLLKESRLKTLRLLLRYSCPLLLANLSMMVYMKSDQVMLEYLSGSEEVGLYSVAARVSESLYFIPIFLSHTYLPRIGRGPGNYQLDLNLRRFYQLAWFIGIAMTFASAIFFAPLVPIVFGEKFSQSSAALIWLSPSAFAASAGFASNAWLNTQGHQKLIAKKSILGATSNILLNFILIPRMGFIGAALATSISQFISTYMIGLFTKETASNFKYLLFPFEKLSSQI